MGDVYLDLTVINDSDPTKQMEIQFLADTGATRAWIPEEIARKLGIKSIGKIPMELANGKIHRLPYGLCKFEYEGEIVNGTVVIGPKGIEPLAGTHVLQDFRLVVDVTHHTIRRSRAMKAKKSGQGSCKWMENPMASFATSGIPKVFERDVHRATKILRDAGCTEIFLFGSAATGKPRAESDLDLAVRGCPRGEFFHLLGSLLIELDHSVDLVNLDAKDAFARRLEAEGALVRVG